MGAASLSSMTEQMDAPRPCARLPWTERISHGPTVVTTQAQGPLIGGTNVLQLP